VKPIIAAVLAVLLTASTALAQGSTPNPALMKRGTTRIVSGAALIGMALGLAVANSGDNSSTFSTALPLTLASAGGVVLLLGARDQRRAHQPSLTVGFSAGRTASVRIMRSW